MPKSKYQIFEIAIFISAFALYSFLAIFAPGDIWNSPDESANAFFINRLANDGSLTYFDPAVVRSDGLIRPRSMAVRDGLLAPGSFVGMIVFYALPVKLLGHSALPFLTPFFSALALIAFGRILKKYLGLRAARLSVILAMLHPALWYYANRGLFHNVLFLDSVIFALFFAIVRPFSAISQKYGTRNRLAQYLDGLFAGGAFILALSVRTFEAIWLIPLALVLLLRNRNDLPRKTFGAALAIIAVAGTLFGLISVSVYGSPLPGGYPKLAILPFGFSFGNMARNGIWYGRLFFWWYTLIVGAGVIYLIYLRIKNKASRPLWRGLLAMTGISLPLCIIYGSGAYLDSPDPAQVTMGNSIIRYWLPLYIGFVPFGAWFLDILMARNKFWRAFAVAVILAASILSARVVFWGRGEGLTLVLRELKRYDFIRSEVISKTPETAIILTDRSDKIFFPLRRVAVGTASPAVIVSLRNLAAIGSLYVYALKMDESDPRPALYEKAGFKLSSELEFGNETLYKLRPSR